MRSQASTIVTTHISEVILMGDRAYKIRRPVSFPFLDLSDVDSRRADCEREVRLNRRLAPDIYLGVGEVSGPGINEPIVIMRRLPSEKNLTHIVIEAGDVHDRLAEIAHRLAAFHEAAECSTAISDGATVMAVRRKWHRNLEELTSSVGSCVSRDRLEAIGRLADRYLEGREALLTERIERGRVCDGHGDLKADDIFCLEDGPRILDCLQFDDGLRHIDVAEDVAALVMDLERLGRPDLGLWFRNRYEAYTNDHPPTSLQHHYIAYRALVRAKVACISAQDGDPASFDQAKLLFALTHTHLERGAVTMVLVGGLPGTGKSTLSGRLCEGQGWTLLSTDSVRKEIMNRPPAGSAAAYGTGIYEQRSRRRVYAEVLRRARFLLARGESVVLDASWNGATDRIDAREVADETSSRLVELWCHSPVEVAVSRMHERALERSDPSDANPAIAQEMASAFDPWLEATRVDTSEGTDAVIERVLGEVLGSGLGETRHALVGALS